jgi:hypothetical protein
MKKKSKRAWPIVTIEDTLPPGWVVMTNPPYPPGRHDGAVTACKHGDEACETCGTSGVTDTLHTTTGGVGKVGALRK